MVIIQSNPIDVAETEYTNSKKLTETLTKAVKSQQNHDIENQSAMKNIKPAIQTEDEKQFTTFYNTIKSNSKDQTKLKMPESFAEQGVYK